MKDRIKLLREKLNLNQTDFAAKINLKRAAIGSYETGVNRVPDRVILDICQAYNVNESWLRFGEGEIFSPPPSINVSLAEAIGNLLQDDNEFTKALFLEYLQLPREAQNALENFLRATIKRCSENHKNGN